MKVLMVLSKKTASVWKPYTFKQSVGKQRLADRRFKSLLERCNDPLVSAHPTPLIMDVLGVPHSPTTDVAALRCNTGSSGRLPLGPGPTIRTDAARCILPSMIGRSARPARFAPGCMVS